MWLHPCNVHLFVSALLWDQTTDQARSYVHMISLLMYKMAALASGPSLLQAAHLRSFHCFPLGVVAVVLCTDAQSYPTLCDPMDYSPPGSSVHGISQAQILEWGVISYSRIPSWPRDWKLGLLRLLRWQVDSLPLTWVAAPSAFYLLQLDGQPKPEAKARCDAQAHRKGDYPFPQPTFFTSRKPCITLLTPTVWAAASLPSLCTGTVVEKDTGPYILVKFHFTVLDPLPFFYCRVLLLIQFSSVAQSCPTLCDPMNHSTPGLPVHHQLPEFTQTHDYRVSNAIQPSHPLFSPSPPAPKSFWDLCKIFDDTDGIHEFSQCDFHILVQALG